MYVEEVIIEGFKSYAARTTVSGFDQSFNAITGLNGSGKSNILDAICFVLGISNLSQVRASSLQDLVYKQGQAGVNKATVSIVFNNEDKAGSPMGYEQFDQITVTRQVVIGGQNKYKINGHVAQLNRVQNLFHSVQLNVNNPHFLIMQGRITKVLNMKPPEILAMIEEAAGTKMYQMKKEASLKVIEKKQKKVDEITKILDEEITPSLQKLRKERAQYMQWTTANTESERLSRFCIAYQYTQLLEKSSGSRERIEELTVEMEEHTATIKNLDKEIAGKTRQIDELSAQRESEMEGEFKELEKKVEELSKQLVKETSAFQHKKEALDSEVAALKELEASAAELISQQKNKGKEAARLTAAVQAQEKAVDDLKLQEAELQRQYQSACAGVDENDGRSLQDQLNDAKQNVAANNTAMQQHSMKLKHVQERLAERKKAMGKASGDFKKLTDERDRLDSILASLKAEIDAFGYDAQKEKSVQDQLAKEQSKLAALREQEDVLSAQLSGLQFNYTDPCKNFDRRQVKGIVASLVKIKQADTATALEVAAGGKLWQVVVSTEVVGQQLLKHGKLAKRVTIVPLNKIEARVLPARVLDNAAAAVGDRAQLALELVGYDHELDAAMKHVFGHTVVCRDLEAAKQVAFSKEIGARSVTLDGDLFEPAGTLTGGARKQGASVLVKLQQLNELREKVAAQEEIVARLQKEVSSLRAVGEKCRRASHQLDLKEHERKLVEERIAATPQQQLIDEVDQLSAQVDEAQAGLKAATAQKKAAEDACKKLATDITKFSDTREKKLAVIQESINKAKAELSKGSAKLKDLHTQYERFDLESGASDKEIGDIQEAMVSSKAAIEKATAEVDQLQAVVASRKSEYDEVKAQLDSKKKSLKDCDTSINKLQKERTADHRKKSDTELEMKKQSHELSRLQKEQKEAARSADGFAEQHSWIASEKKFFGKEGTDYDFKAKDPHKAQVKLAQLLEEVATLGKKINRKVMGMFEKAEQEYQELMGKKRIIENDKSKIEDVIRELDEKKNQTLRETYKKVNRDFGSIFTTLLPGTQAKLEPPEGMDVTEGLCVCVAFGDVWKESLSELSGGQRSLLALSLVLALLLFKPAPMYILDEIDAALDMSHTQNIGAMIRTHFKHSQFIVVSLKEGMFSNANVLFKTKFVDGISTVARTTPTSKKAVRG